VADLERLAKDERAAVRRRVAAALGRIRGAGAGKVLVLMLDDRDGEVRDESLESLYSLSGGETFDYDPERAAAQQEDALLQWREWVTGNPGA